MSAAVLSALVLPTSQETQSHTGSSGPVRTGTSGACLSSLPLTGLGQAGPALPPCPSQAPRQLSGCRAFCDPWCRTAHSCRGGWGPNSPHVQSPAAARNSRTLAPGPAWSPPQGDPLSRNSEKRLANVAGAWLAAQCPGKPNDAEPRTVSQGICSPGACGVGGSGAAETVDSLRADWKAVLVPGALWAACLARPHLPTEELPPGERPCSRHRL